MKELFEIHDGSVSNEQVQLKINKIKSRWIPAAESNFCPKRRIWFTDIGSYTGSGLVCKPSRVFPS